MRLPRHVIQPCQARRPAFVHLRSPPLLCPSHILSFTSSANPTHVEDHHCLCLSSTIRQTASPRLLLSKDAKVAPANLRLSHILSDSFILISIFIPTGEPAHQASLRQHASGTELHGG